MSDIQLDADALTIEYTSGHRSGGQRDGFLFSPFPGNREDNDVVEVFGTPDELRSIAEDIIRMVDSWEDMEPPPTITEHEPPGVS